MQISYFFSIQIMVSLVFNDRNINEIQKLIGPIGWYFEWSLIIWKVCWWESNQRREGPIRNQGYDVTCRSITYTQALTIETIQNWVWKYDITGSKLPQPRFRRPMTSREPANLLRSLIVPSTAVCYLKWCQIRIPREYSLLTKCWRDFRAPLSLERMC